MTNLLGQETEEDKFCPDCGFRLDACVCNTDEDSPFVDDYEIEDYEVSGFDFPTDFGQYTFK
jgi:hypothetical protein